MPLKRMFASVRGGSWGSEPGTDELDLPCIRGTDLDSLRMLPTLDKAPLRSYSRDDAKYRAARAGDIIIETSGGGDQQIVSGKSMEPRIADGAYAVLRFPVEGSRNGRIVLLELTEAEDPEGGGCYTLKRWRSEKTAAEESEGGWQHERIVLESLNPDVPSITLTNAEGARVIAEFVATV